MAVFTMYVDETGTISSVADSGAYGFGCAIFPDNLLKPITAKVVKAFPNGIHLKNWRGDKRKESNTRKAMAIIENFTAVFGCAYIFRDTEYANNLFYENLADVKGRHGALAKKQIEEAAKKATPNAAGIIAPDLFPEVLNTSRLVHVYTAALRNPIVGLLRIVPDPAELDLTIRIGQVGMAQKFNEQLAMISDSLLREFAQSMEHFRNLRIVSALPKREASLEFVSDLKIHPLFGFADIFAGIGRHIYEDDSVGSLGRRLHLIASKTLRRLQMPVSTQRLADGVFVS